MRLLDKAIEIGILSEDKIETLKKAKEDVLREVENLKALKVPMKQANEILKKYGSDKQVTKGITANELLKFKEITYEIMAKELGLNIEEYPKANEILKKYGSDKQVTKGITANELLKFKEITYEIMAKELGLNIEEYPNFVRSQIETMTKYDIFIKRENEQIEKFKRLEGIMIPKDFDFEKVVGISNIARAGLCEVKPLSIGLCEVKPLSIGEASRISGVTGNDIAILLGHIQKR